MENNRVKEFLKENLLLFLIFFVVIFGLGGYKIYSSIKSNINSDYEFNDLPQELDSEIRSFEANEYKVITMTDQDLAEFYLDKIVKIWDKSSGDLYELLTPKAKESYESKEDFIKKMDKLKTSLTKYSTVDAYSVTNGTIIIQTNEGTQFKLVTYGINDYQISYIGKF